MTTTADRPTLITKQVRVPSNLPTSDYITTEGLTPVGVYFPTGLLATTFGVQVIVRSSDGTEWSLGLSEYGGKNGTVIYPLTTDMVTLLPAHLFLGVKEFFFNFDAGTPGDTTIYVYLRKFA